jgi:hypothetical protein
VACVQAILASWWSSSSSRPTCWKSSYVEVKLLMECSLRCANIYLWCLCISTNNIARGMVRGSQIRFQSIKSTLLSTTQIYPPMPRISKITVRHHALSSPLSHLVAPNKATEPRALPLPESRRLCSQRQAAAPPLPR